MTADSTVIPTLANDDGGDATTDLTRKVEAIGRAYVQYSRETPHYFDACSQFQAYQAGDAEGADQNEEACLAASRQVHGVLVEALRTGMQDGTIRADLENPLMTAIALWGFAHGIIQLAATKAEMLAKFNIAIDPLVQHGFGLFSRNCRNLGYLAAH